MVESGIEDLIVLKTTRSGFAGYMKDPYTTLPETTDRIFSTAVKAVWRYVGPDAATRETFLMIRETILETFAGARQPFRPAHALCDGRGRFG